MQRLYFRDARVEIVDLRQRTEQRCRSHAAGDHTLTLTLILILTLTLILTRTRTRTLTLTRGRQWQRVPRPDVRWQRGGAPESWCRLEQGLGLGLRLGLGLGLGLRLDPHPKPKKP